MPFELRTSRMSTALVIGGFVENKNNAYILRVLAMEYQENKINIVVT